jgi:hypothetical protein
MSQWGEPFKDAISGGTFLPHLAGPALKPVSLYDLIDDVVLIDVDKSTALLALIAGQKLKAAFLGKTYASWFELKKELGS